MHTANSYLTIPASVILITLFLGCASTPTATTPMPTSQLTAIGQDSSKGGSFEVAMQDAKGFCKRWGAAPNVEQKEVRYQGKLQEGANTVVSVATDVARAAGNWIPGFGSNDAYETTLTYKCY